MMPSVYVFTEDQKYCAVEKEHNHTRVKIVLVSRITIVE